MPLNVVDTYVLLDKNSTVVMVSTHSITIGCGTSSYNKGVLKGDPGIPTYLPVIFTTIKFTITTACGWFARGKLVGQEEISI